MIWFIVLTTILNNGDVYTEVRPATSPEYNTQEQCIAAGQLIVDQKQIEIGTTNGKVYYICHSLTSEEILKALGEPGSNT